MNYLLLVLATVTSASNSLLWKKTSAQTKDDRILHLKSAFIFFVSALIVMIYALLTNTLLMPSAFTLMLAIAFALSKTMQQTALLFAMRIGATSITQLIFALGILLPIFYGAIALGEEISLMQYIGMALFFVALCFIVNPKADKSFRVVWLLLCLLAACTSGVNAVLQKMHQASVFFAELESFVVLSLALSALFSLGLSGLEAARRACKRKEESARHATLAPSEMCEDAPTVANGAASVVVAEAAPVTESVSVSAVSVEAMSLDEAWPTESDEKNGDVPTNTDGRAKRNAAAGRTLLFLFGCGFCVGLQNLLSFMLAGRLPAVIHFPIYNIGSIVLVGFGGRLFYGERLSRMQLIGFAIGCAAIVCIGLF